MHRATGDRLTGMQWRLFGDGSSVLLYLGKHQVAAIHAEGRKSAHRSEGSGTYTVLNPWQITFRLPGTKIMMAEKTIESAKEAAEKHVKAWIEEAGLEVKNACS